ncbi:MAG: hypothetical protein ACK53L_22310, partial [Pirellulaceae bacterium]
MAFGSARTASVDDAMDAVAIWANAGETASPPCQPELPGVGERPRQSSGRGSKVPASVAVLLRLSSNLN